MKKIFLLSLISLIAAHAWALTSITTGSISGSPFCGGDAVNVPFQVDGAAYPGNFFTAQLSDANGSFASPVNIGSVSGINSGVISATIPLGTPSGTRYHIRVVSSKPVTVGSANTKNLKINPKPSGTSVTGATACSATLNWKSTGTASSYKTRYKKSSDPNSAYTTAVNVGNVLSYTFTGLESNTSYDFQVRSVCPNGELSDWKKQTGSTTACPVPTGFTLTALTVTTATLDWNDMTCATGYRIRYKYYGEPNWGWYTTSSSSTKVLTGLFPATSYDAQVASLCGADSSAYSGSISWEQPYFKTAAGSTITNSLIVYPNPSNGTFALEFNSAQDNNAAEITIQNVLGQVIYSSIKNYHSGVNTENISLPEASGGMYLIRVKAGVQTFESSVMVK
ncbi:MAG: fibronectin type III domain-containing protein [Chitinophagales bacterium]